MTRIATIAAVFLISLPLAAAGIDVIPAPERVTMGEGAFKLSSATAIVVESGDEESKATAAWLADLIERTTGLRLATRAGPASDRAINLRRERADAPGGRESYRVEVTPARITLSASAHEGIVHAATTLWQLVPARRQATLAIDSVAIDDAPRFAWRGMMLDSARHFQSPDFIRRFIDAMAVHKLNVLHWHLTDDQAWRLEIRKYPKLTEVGAWRVPAGAARNEIDPATGKPRLLFAGGRARHRRPCDRARHHHRPRDRRAGPHERDDRRLSAAGDGGTSRA
jgi:hexosaminidase